VLGRLFEEAALGSETGVGEDDVDATEVMQRGPDHVLLLAEVRHVAGDGDRALGAAELLGERLELVGRVGGEHEAVAAGRRVARRGGADAA